MPTLPDNPSLEWLRKKAKLRLEELRKTTPGARLAHAQFDLAKEYGFSSWRALKAYIDSLTLDGQIIDAARKGDVKTLRALLDQHPDKLHVEVPPYKASLLFPAVASGNTGAVDLLLERGLDVNYREGGDNTCAMHWAAAEGKLDMVKKLADAGGDVIGDGDDHAGGVIGWASCWPGCDDVAHRKVVEFLVSRGARHHIFSAIALQLEDEVRSIVAADPAALSRRQSRNENNRTPLHFAVSMRRPRMVQLLVDLGADPLSVDGDGMPVAVYAVDPDIDVPVMRKIRDLTLAELDSATRGRRSPNVRVLDLVAAIATRDFQTAGTVTGANPQLANAGALHLLAKRGDAAGVGWLLDRGADPNGLWAHWDSTLTPLHLAIMQDHIDVVRLLLDNGAAVNVRDTKHNGDASDWAEFFKRTEILPLLKRDTRP